MATAVGGGFLLLQVWITKMLASYVEANTQKIKLAKCLLALRPFM